MFLSSVSLSLFMCLGFLFLDFFLGDGFLVSLLAVLSLIIMRNLYLFPCFGPYFSVCLSLSIFIRWLLIICSYSVYKAVAVYLGINSSSRVFRYP